jgi:hypothetical protein
MVQLVHELPRRIRFVVSSLKGDRFGAATFSARFQVLGGVTAATLNPLTGSLIVHYDGSAETRDRILRNFEEFGSESVEPPVAMQRLAKAPARLDEAIADLVVNALAECLTERMVRMAVAALI